MKRALAPLAVALVSFSSLTACESQPQSKWESKLAASMQAAGFEDAGIMPAVDGADPNHIVTHNVRMGRCVLGSEVAIDLDGEGAVAVISMDAPGFEQDQVRTLGGYTMGRFEASSATEVDLLLAQAGEPTCLS